MSHGLDPKVIALMGGCVVVWAVLSARLERFDVTAPLAFMAIGLVTTHGPFAIVELNVHATTIRGLAEATLALVLFVDASRVNVRALRADAVLPARLLGIGLPLAVAGGAALAAALFGGINLWVAATLGAIVAPTDAALAAPILRDERVPHRVRRLLNVESGLNDGLATPFVALFLAGALSEEAVDAAGVGQVALDVLKGVGLGVLVGVVGALVLRGAQRRGWTDPVFRPMAVFGLAVLSYAGTVAAHGNGFVAAFVAGMAFGSLMPADDEGLVGFADEAGGLLSLLVWFIFGAVMVSVFDHATWSDLVFAVVALSVVRIAAVALALVGSGLDRVTVAFVGWFGPRGLASVIFAILAADSLKPADGNLVLAAVTVTVALSVVCHGLSGAPLARRYGLRAAVLERDRPEHAPQAPLRARSLVGRRGGQLRRGDRPDLVG